MAVKDDYQDFKVALNDLKLNSKPLINFLTILAEEKLPNAPQIVRAMEERILETKGDHVLPALYVLDSIVKNLRSSVYVQLFEAKLPVLFSHAFNKVDERTRSAMFKLRQTWSPFFTNLSLYNLDTRAHDIDSAWPITAKVPDPPPFSPNIHLNPSFLQRSAPSSSTLSADQQPISDEVQQQILWLQQEDPDSSTFRTRTVSQPPISIAPPKISELSTRSDSYHMIPIDRMEQIRQETAHVLDIGVDGEQQSKIKKLTGKKKKPSKKRRPSARLRRRAAALAQVMTGNDPDSSDEDETGEEGLENVNADDDDDDEPFIIKQSSAVNNGLRTKSTVSVADSTSGGTENDVEVLFGGTDKDYRDSDVTSKLDADSIYEINSKCLSLAEQKYKSKELSSEEYQATLTLLQNILVSEVKRLSTQQQQQQQLSPLMNGSHQQPFSSPVNSLNTTTTTTSYPFQQQLLQFTQQHAPQITAIPQPSSLPTFPNSPFPGFGNEAYRHVMQILTSVGAPSSYISNYNFLSFVPPLPPAPPSFALVQQSFQSQQQPSTSLDHQLFSGRQSPPMKRTHDENNNNEENPKRTRYDPVTGRATRSRNFDEENVAPVPSLVDANINMLRKKYIGVIQQLYVGKFQCRLCGLRFTAKQKHHYTHHLDWHYLENKQEKELNTITSSTTLLQRTRQWYPSVKDWTIYDENIEEQIRTGKIFSIQSKPIKDNHLLLQGDNILSSSGVISCPATGNGDSDDDRCYVCHDPFENFFDDNREEWHLKDAVRVDGKTYHPICYQDVQHEITNERLLSTDPSLVSSNAIVDRTDNLPSDKPAVDLTSSIHTEHEDEVPPLTTDSTKPNYLSSMFDLVETIYIKKQDLETVEQLPNISEQAVFLSTSDAPNSETLISKNSEERETTLD